MSYLTVNGVPLAASYDKGMTRSDVEIGNDGERSIDGTITRDTRGFKTNWTSVVVPDSQQNQNAWRQLLRGDGDHWTFTAAQSLGGNSYSDKGANVITLANGAAYSNTGGKYGGEIVLSSSTYSATFAGYTPAAGWTAVLWAFVSGVWSAWTLFGGSTITGVYKNGASTTQNFASLSGTSLVFTNSTECHQISDVQIYPFQPDTNAQSTWAAGFYAFQQTQAFPTSPLLALGGDFGTYSCQGQAASSTVVQMAIAGNWDINAEWLDFVLQQE